MELDRTRFFQAYNPSKTLVMGKAEDRQYYIDFSQVRGAKVIDQLKRTIARISPEDPTCQLFTGHIGCGKSTELLRLKAELEHENLNFHVVYFESSQILDMADVDITDILLAIAGEVSKSLAAVKIDVKPGYFKNLFKEVSDLFTTPIDIDLEAELSLGIAKINAKTRENDKSRRQVKQCLEPRTNGILDSINQDIIQIAQEKLQQQGKKGLVIIVDGLDKIAEVLNLKKILIKIAQNMLNFGRRIIIF